MHEKDREESIHPYRLLVADAGGSTTRLLEAHAEKLQVDVVSFAQPEMLATAAAKEGGDLVVMAEPTSLGPLERLRNDPRTRHIRVILMTSSLNDPEKRFDALMGADQILDYPSESRLLLDWVTRGLQGQLQRSDRLDYATAQLKESGEGHWLGRICWVGEKTLRLETDIVPRADSIFPLTGPLMSAIGMSACPATIRSVSEADMYYAHGARLELEIPDSIRVSLKEFCEKQHGSISSRKTKLGVLCEDGASLAKVAALVDSSLYAIRWVQHTNALASTLKQLNPALLLVDPNHSELADPVKAAALVRASKDGPPLVPLAEPEEMRLWDRLGERCPTTQVPADDDKQAWDALLSDLLSERLEEERDDRVYLRRDHPYSHGRLTIPCALNDLSEAGGGIRTMCKVLDDARARFDIPNLLNQGMSALHGRVLSGDRAKQKLQVIWMGVGGDREATLLRRYVSGVIMAGRREEFNA